MSTYFSSYYYPAASDYHPFFSLGPVIFSLAISIFYLASMWKIFEKAGQKGWKALVPVYNAYIMLKIVGRPGWWLFLFLIPLVNIGIALIIAIDLSRSFGKSTTFGVLLLFIFSFIGYPILAFGGSKYKKR